MRLKVLIEATDALHMLDMPSGMELVGASFENGQLVIETETDLELGADKVTAVYGPVVDEGMNLAGFDPFNDDV